MNPIIRCATVGDRAAWVRLRRRLWPDCPTARHRLEVRQLLAGDGVIALACVDKEVVGFAEVSLRGDHVEGTTATPVPYLEGWYVSPRHRGHGVGRALLGFVEKWARTKGYRELASDAEIANRKSILAHAKLGFSEVGRSVHYVKRLDMQLGLARRSRSQS